MRQITHKLVYIILTIALMICIFPADTVRAESIRTKSDSYAYYNPALKSNVAVIEISGLTKDQRIVKESIASSNASVGKIKSYTRRSFYSNTAKVDSKSRSSERKSYSYLIRVNLYAVGDTTISYTIDGTAYSTVLHVTAYSSPVSSVSVAGVNSSANLVTDVDFSKGYGTGRFANVNKKNAKLKITPSTGWRVISVSSENESTGYEYKKYNNSSTKSISSFNLGTLKQDEDVNIQIVFADSYGNSMSLTLRLSSPANLK